MAFFLFISLMASSYAAVCARPANGLISISTPTGPQQINISNAVPYGYPSYSRCLITLAEETIFETYQFKITLEPGGTLLINKFDATAVNHIDNIDGVSSDPAKTYYKHNGKHVPFLTGVAIPSFWMHDGLILKSCWGFTSCLNITLNNQTSYSASGSLDFSADGKPLRLDLWSIYEGAAKCEGTLKIGTSTFTPTTNVIFNDQGYIRNFTYIKAFNAPYAPNELEDCAVRYSDDYSTHEITCEPGK